MTCNHSKCCSSLLIIKNTPNLTVKQLKDLRWGSPKLGEGGNFYFRVQSASSKCTPFLSKWGLASVTLLVYSWYFPELRSIPENFELSRGVTASDAETDSILQCSLSPPLTAVSQDNHLQPLEPETHCDSQFLLNNFDIVPISSCFSSVWTFDLHFKRPISIYQSMYPSFHVNRVASLHPIQ